MNLDNFKSYNSNSKTPINSNNMMTGNSDFFAHNNSFNKFDQTGLTGLSGLKSYNSTPNKFRRRAVSQQKSTKKSYFFSNLNYISHFF